MLSRRKFIRNLLIGTAVGASGCGRKKDSLSIAPEDILTKDSASFNGSLANEFLKSVSSKHSGKTIRILTEGTPPSRGTYRLAIEEFSRLTGINVKWDLLPLKDVYARTLVDTLQRRGNYDIFYIDQSWVGKFAKDLIPVEELLGLDSCQFPDWDRADFLDPLVKHTASYAGTQIGVPYDITIFIGMYRRSVFNRLGLSRPKSIQDWLAVAKIIYESSSPSIFGTTAQWKVGHYSLLCSMSSWLWAMGGSFFDSDGTPAVDDDRGIAALEYMMELLEYMPPGVTTWDWNGEYDSFLRGEAGFYSSWCEFFPGYNIDEHSRVKDDVVPFTLPTSDNLRRPNRCGFGEIPGISHQGGSCIGISKYSTEIMPAWAFLQWATSKDIAARVSHLGGGANATRFSTYSDPRVTGNEGMLKVNQTLHLPVVLQSILNTMGTEPHYSGWPDIAMGPLPVELGKMVTRQQSPELTAKAMAQHLARSVEEKG